MAQSSFFSADAERKLSTLIAMHHGLGLPTEPLSMDDAHALQPMLGRQAQAAALLPFEGSVDNRALTRAVLAAAIAHGVEVCANCKITSLLTDSLSDREIDGQDSGAAQPKAARSDADKSRCTGVVANGENISAGHVVMAAGAFCGNIAGLAASVVTRPIRGQMVALSGTDVPLHRVLRSDRGYLVPRHNSAPKRIVAGSTLEDAGFEKCVTPAGLEHILSAAQELLSGIGNAEILETWCGLRPDTPDHLPIIGPGELENLTIATGHYRNGILLAPITAKLVREWITEKRVSMDWEIFSPARFSQRPPDAAADRA